MLNFGGLRAIEGRAKTACRRSTLWLPLVGAMALLAFSVLAEPVHAQDGAGASRSREARRARTIARVRREPRRHTPAVAPLPLPEGPLVLVVSLDKQRLSVYSKGKLAETSTVSTGTARDPTPSGVFAIVEKQEQHYSNIFRGASMPFMQRLTLTGVALHSGHVTGRVESHGCVRLPHEYARRLFQMTRLGGRVVVSTDDPVPTDITAMQLLDPERIAAAKQATAALQTASISTTDEQAAPRPIPAVERSIDPRNKKVKGPVTLKRDEELRAAPVSILVSRAEKRVYVWHTFEPQIEAEIAIDEPRRPLGTHVYTLAEVQPDGSGQQWSAVTVAMTPRKVPVRKVRYDRRGRVIKDLEAAKPAAAEDEGTPSTAAEAVQRFVLPPAVVAQIAPLLRPGTSLVVTDLPPSKRMRTWWTDIIVSP